MLLQAEHSGQGRRWVMPMRLPAAKPDEAAERWAGALAAHGERGCEQLGLVYPLGGFAPPGLAERLMSSCYAFGTYHKFWRGGALIETRVRGALLLIELRERSPSSDEPGGFQLAIELRGPTTARAELWALLLQLRGTADALVSSFGGLAHSVQAHVVCPGCVRQGRGGTGAVEPPTLWTVTRCVEGRQTCARCSEVVALGHVEPAKLPPPKVPLQLPAEAAKAEAEADADASGRFVAKLTFGEPIEAAYGLHKLLGIADEDTLFTLRLKGTDAIHEEV